MKHQGATHGVGGCRCGGCESFHRVGGDDSEDMGDALCVTEPGLELASRMSGMMVFGVGAGSVPDEPIRA